MEQIKRFNSGLRKNNYPPVKSQFSLIYLLEMLTDNE